MRALLVPLTHTSVFLVLTLAWSGYQAYVGAIAGGFICDSARKEKALSVSPRTRMSAYVVPHALFYFVCALAGFVAWWCITMLAVSITDWSSVDGGTGAVMIALASIAITGLSGALPRILHLGGRP